MDRSISSDAKADWDAALRGDRNAFETVVAPHLGELVEAAEREMRYRVARGDLRAEDLPVDELVGAVLARAWRDRNRRPSRLGARAWLLALLFRVLTNIVRRETRIRKLAEVPLAALPPEPLYDDDESFWEWYQPDQLTRCEVLVDKTANTLEQAAAADELAQSLQSRAREAFLMSELHRVDLSEIALALGVSLPEAVRLTVEARRLVGMEADGNVS